MKNIIKTIIFSTVLLFASCSDWLDVNTDPNNPTEVNSDLILPAGQASIATRLGGTLFNMGGFFAQYWAQAPEANQYNTLETYDLRTDFLDGDYNEMFAGGLNDLERVRTDAAAAENWGDYFAATVLRAFAYQVWIDMIDQVPYEEAFQGTTFINPRWEAGSTVYFSLIDEIDEARSKLESSSRVSVSDLMLDADLEQWIGFANALKLKLYMRASYQTDVSTEVNALITEDNFMTVDVSFNAFENASNKRNPWYETTQQLNTDRNHVATVNIIRFLTVNADPRISVLYNVAANSGSYEGIYPALKQIQQGLRTDDYSRPNFDPVQPVYFLTLAELNLFIAEAELRFNNDAVAAQAAYHNAIDASLALHGLPATDLYTDPTAPYYFDVTETDDVLFEQILMQKWVSLCQVNNFEAWCELRRTKVPQYFGGLEEYGDGSTYVPGQYLNPAKNVRSEGIYVPYRLPYPDVAATRNTNTPKLTSNQAFETEVWWDVK